MQYAGEIIDVSTPQFFVGYSTCYRRESGSAGKDVGGIFRVHQFDKMEMYCFCKPEDSPAMHETLRDIEEEIMQELGLHYRVVNIAAGDLGMPATKKYDIEVWLPGQGRYRELTSCSNCTDYQARRAGIRYRTEKGTRFVHTLNGTAAAMTRTIIALLENGQKEDGSVELPACLAPFLVSGTTIA